MGKKPNSDNKTNKASINNQEGELVDIEDISDKDWAEIKEIAQYMYDRGDYGQFHFKIAIAAFFVWMRQKGPHAAVGLDNVEKILNWRPIWVEKTGVNKNSI